MDKEIFSRYIADKKILIGIGVLIAAVLIAVTFIWIINKGGLPEIVPIPAELPAKEAEVVAVGDGWSVKDNPVEAVREAVASVKEELKGKSPEFAVLHTVGYDPEEVMKEARRLLPDTKIYGGSSYYGVITREGYHVAEKNALAVLAVTSPKIDFGVAGINIEDFPSYKEAGKQAILAAIKDAGREGELPQIVLMTSAMLGGKEQEEITGIEEVIGKDIPIIGGSAPGSPDFFDINTMAEYASDKVYHTGLALTAIFTDLKIGWAYETGFFRTEKSGVVTKIEGETVYEIDSRPALEVYDEWTNGIFKELIEKGEKFTYKDDVRMMLNVTAKAITGKHMETHYRIRTVIGADPPNKTLQISELKEGERIYLMRGNWELFLNRSQTTALKAMASRGIERNEGYFAISVTCLGLPMAIPLEEHSKFPLLISSAIGGSVPFIGAFTGGEQGLVEGVGNEHGNFVNAIIIFAPIE